MKPSNLNEYKPSRLDRRLGGVLVAAMVAVLVGLSVDALTGPALAGAAPDVDRADRADRAGATVLAAAPAPAAVR